MTDHSALVADARTASGQAHDELVEKIKALKDALAEVEDLAADFRGRDAI